MRVLITGADGQLGKALQRTAPAQARITAVDVADMDITDRDSVEAGVTGCRPDIIFNAAAYTAVDKAEAEEASAQAVNATAVGLLAAAAAKVGARLVHVSTDFVFDGAASTPYGPDAEPHPLGAYGRTKLAGERAAGPEALIVRTGWLYAPTGANFVRTMLRLMAERPEVRVVADQIGTPTYAPGLASALWDLGGEQGLSGVYHYADAGVASWYDFAVAIQEEALLLGLLQKPALVLPITTADYPTPARRPHYSVLDTRKTWTALGRPAPHWRASLRTMLNELKIHG